MLMIPWRGAARASSGMRAGNEAQSAMSGSYPRSSGASRAPEGTNIRSPSGAAWWRLTG
jgi:hypothetical protein